MASQQPRYKRWKIHPIRLEIGREDHSAVTINENQFVITGGTDDANNSSYHSYYHSSRRSLTSTNTEIYSSECVETYGGSFDHDHDHDDDVSLYTLQWVRVCPIGS